MSWMGTERPKRRELLWPATDETMRNWLNVAVRGANDDGVHFSITVTPHTLRQFYIMHMLYLRQPTKVIQALAGHQYACSMEVYTRVFMLDVAATLAVLAWLRDTVAWLIIVRECLMTPVNAMRFSLPVHIQRNRYTLSRERQIPGGP